MLKIQSGFKGHYECSPRQPWLHARDLVPQLQQCDVIDTPDDVKDSILNCIMTVCDFSTCALAIVATSMN